MSTIRLLMCDICNKPDIKSDLTQLKPAHEYTTFGTKTFSLVPTSAERYTGIWQFDVCAPCAKKVSLEEVSEKLAARLEEANKRDRQDLDGPGWKV